MTKQTTLRRHIAQTLFMGVCLIFLLLSGSMPGNAASSQTPEDERSDLWGRTAGYTEADDEDASVARAFLKYCRDGVFGPDARSWAVTEANDNTSLGEILAAVPEASSFYQAARQYGLYTASAIAAHDKDGTRVQQAYERVTDIFQTVVSIFVVFGFFTSLLTFSVMFARWAWLPEHLIQRRDAITDMLKIGIATAIFGNAWLIVNTFNALFSRFWATYAVYSKDWRTVALMVLSEYKGFVAGVGGVCTLFILIMFLISFTSLAASSSNPNQKDGAVKKLVHCGIAAAGIGSLLFCVSFFWSLIA